MKFVITGASGHIGNNLVRMINERFPEARIVALLRRNVQKELFGAKCKQVIGDLLSEQFLRENISSDDIVIHCAAFIDMSDKQSFKTFEINFTMTKRICDICHVVGVTKFIYLSSVDAIYKAGNGGEIVEPKYYYPEKIEGFYGSTKALATSYVLKVMGEDATFNAGIILPSAVIGANDYKPSEVGGIIKRTLKGGLQFGIKGGYNFVGVLDVCSAILSLAVSEHRGQYIVAGENISVEELYMAINEYKGINRKPIILPTFIARLACPFIKVLTPLTIKALQEEHNYSSKRAMRHLCYKITPFKEVLKSTIDWLESH